jgi:hypothetical protein
MRRNDHRSTLVAGVFLALGVSVMSGWTTAAGPPEPPVDLLAKDKPLDGGGVVELTWEASATPAADLKGYEIRMHELKITPAEQAVETDEQADAEAREQTEDILEGEGIAPEDADHIARERDSNLVHVPIDESEWSSVGIVPVTQLKYEVAGLDKSATYVFAIRALGSDGTFSENSNLSAKVEPVASIINGKKIPLFIILAIICGAVFLFVVLARRGMPMKIREIAGLKAVDEAVGRATEMGRSILFINGIQDMDDLQTVAGVTVLGHVAKTAAEYDAKIEVPTSRSLVMTAARETVQSSYFAAGRPDAYNPDLIYYVTDEQFGFVAYVSGMMTREKPAACFYMGAFFAESLILAETGNSVGAIQIAGTAMPSQLPFFVAACDYTLIGEEFFAASAYLSGQPDQLGSLKGQDVGKILVGLLIIIGVTLATLAAITAGIEVLEPFHDAMVAAVDFLVNVILGK